MAQINLNTLKENIQTVLEAANTTTASVFLSNGMARRVQKVAKLNPGFVPSQATWYPLVTVFIDSKTTEEITIARTQLTGKRRANVDVHIAGMVWNSNVLKGTEDTDPADNDCELLMENIEEILRADPTMTNVCTWSHPIGVTFHTLPYAEQTHLRAGLLKYRAVYFY